MGNQHIGKSGYRPGEFGYEFDCDLDDCILHFHPLDRRDSKAGVLEIEPPEGKVAHLGIGHMIQAAPDMLNALELIYANAGESPEWIRARIGKIIAKAKGET